MTASSSTHLSASSAALAAPIVLQVIDEELIVDRERFVFALTQRKVGNLESVWLKFCIMLTSVHVESEGSALALAHVSACLMEDMGSVVTCPYSHAAHALRRKAT